MRVVTSSRGAAYYRCERADTDPRYVRYPRLPLHECPGFASKAGESAVRGQRETPPSDLIGSEEDGAAST
jgi:hypothetical protein